VVDENGNWYFLEVNPSGQWLWIESLTGFEISDSIVDWISKNS
jgi:glutathione synthase/RimK-type ligase-like ATP-grasp enzyme